jgi:hypothetical protein
MFRVPGSRLKNVPCYLLPVAGDRWLSGVEATGHHNPEPGTFFIQSQSAVQAHPVCLHYAEARISV